MAGRNVAVTGEPTCASCRICGAFCGLPALADEPEFHIGVVASVTGPFAAPTNDTFDGFNAWMKVHGLPGKKIVLQTLDDETNPVNASNAFRKLASDQKISLIYLFINSNSAMAAKSFASEFKVPIITGGGPDALGNPADRGCSRWRRRTATT